MCPHYIKCKNLKTVQVDLSSHPIPVTFGAIVSRKNMSTYTINITEASCSLYLNNHVYFKDIKKEKNKLLYLPRYLAFLPVFFNNSKYSSFPLVLFPFNLKNFL